MSFYDSIGVRPLINAATTFTAIGGSLMPGEVLDAMRAAAGAFVDMHELHEQAGAELARLTRNQAAYVTSGCAAAIVLSILGCRTRGEPRRMAALPDDPDLPDEVVIHTAHRIPYDPAVRLAGARIRNVGDVLQTFDWQLDGAITERTAAVFWVAGSHLPSGALPLTEVVRIAHGRGVPVIVDAAAQLPPPENLWNFTRAAGADIALFSGGKALRGPQASGLMVGRADLIAAARANGAPHQRLARAMKVGKEEVAGLVAAVRRYLALDHAALLAGWARDCADWADQINSVAGVTAVVDPLNEAGQPVPRVRVVLDAQARRPSLEVVASLRHGQPAIVVLPGQDSDFYIGADLLEPGEAEVVISRVLAELRREQEGGRHGPSQVPG
jgi:L-seryl-tRNA(Ser) seleniumtransferase